MATVLSATRNHNELRHLHVPLLAHQVLPSVMNSSTTLIHKILERRDLSALFQPIIDLKSGDFIGFEGLIRGPADSALHSPINLFCAAEQQGLSLEIEMLSRQIVLTAFAAQNLPGKLFLNVSPKVLSQPNFKNGLTLEFMRELQLDPARVVIEITENQPTFDFNEMRSGLLHYRSMGFHIAIDDLGEGFSTLRLWSELRPDFIKIDMHFVQGVDRDPIKLQFLKSIQSIAKSCGTRVIAEGVETEAELKTVKNLGIAFGQGYFIARPSHTPPLLADQATSRVINATKIALFPQYTSGTQAQVTAQAMLAYVEAASPETSNAQIFARFSADSALRVIPIVKGGKPLGLLNRHRFMNCYNNAQQNDSLSTQSCQHLLMTEPLLVDKSMPIEELSQFLVEAEGHHLDDGFIVTEQGRYLGIASGQNLLRELTRMHQEAARYADPLTLLPGKVPIQKHIESLLRTHLPFVACCCDLNNFKPFNQVYGYDKGDEMLQLGGRVLSSVCDAKKDFIGHLGCDHFILLMQSPDWKSRCERALNHFAQTAQVMFDAAHLSAGGYQQLDRAGNLQFFNLPRLSIGAVAVMDGQFMSHHEVSAAINAANRQAKQLSGNSLFIEQRNKLT